MASKYFIIDPSVGKCLASGTEEAKARRLAGICAEFRGKVLLLKYDMDTDIALEAATICCGGKASAGLPQKHGKHERVPT